MRHSILLTAVGMALASAGVFAQTVSGSTSAGTPSSAPSNGSLAGSATAPGSNALPGSNANGTITPGTGSTSSLSNSTTGAASSGLPVGQGRITAGAAQGCNTTTTIGGTTASGTTTPSDVTTDCVLGNDTGTGLPATQPSTSGTTTGIGPTLDTSPSSSSTSR